jgi:hypothetical protein
MTEERTSSMDHLFLNTFAFPVLRGSLFRGREELSDYCWGVKLAGDIGMAELIDLLPARPDDAVVCCLCEGSRWESAESSRWCCRRCCGLGWTLA